jgi:transposase
MRTFDARFKQKVVRAYLSGKGGYKILAAKYNIADSLVRRWVRAYQHHGSAGLVRQRGRYPCEFKLEVLHRLAAENLSCRKLAAMYNIGNPHTITVWLQQHERGELRSLQYIPHWIIRCPQRKRPRPSLRSLSSQSRQTAYSARMNGCARRSRT